MYSGLTITDQSGRLFGVHQKFDRVARRHLRELLQDSNDQFPTIKSILQFEGKNGPDGIKRKSPAKDEPWHYIDPFDDEDTQLTVLIQDHYDALIVSLKKDDLVRAAFEAAWLAHALVDGLTPAHHFPYEEELVKLRGGEGIESRDTLLRKVILPGKTIHEQLFNNWKMWGPKGLLTTHFAFEHGVAALVVPLQLNSARPSKTDLRLLQTDGIVGVFRHKAREIASLRMYDTFYTTSWTPRLARQVRHDLAPSIVSMITLAWYGASEAAKA